MKELGIFYVYKKRNNTISQMLGELGTKEEELDWKHQKRNKRTIIWEQRNNELAKTRNNKNIVKELG